MTESAGERDADRASAGAAVDEGSPRHPTVLHVDDDPQVGSLVAAVLERAAEEATVLTETDGERALRRLECDEVDCLVTDLEMPGTDGVDILRTLAEDDPDVPVVVFSSRDRADVAGELPAGAVTEYVRKSSDHEQYEAVADAVGEALG